MSDLGPTIAPAMNVARTAETGPVPVPTTHRRRRRLIDQRLQLRFAAAIASVAVIGLIVQCLTLTQQVVVLASEVPNDREFVLGSLPGMLTTSMFVTLALMLPISLFVGVALTFPVVGPLYRIKTHLRALRDGTATGPCKIRKGDELQDLCDLINDVTQPQQRAEVPGADQVGGGVTGVRQAA
jgi:hypothetical protein